MADVVLQMSPTGDHRLATRLTAWVPKHVFNQYKAKVEGIPGHGYSKRHQVYTYPRSMDTCWALRKAFGDTLKVDNEVSAWARAELAKMEAARALVSGEDAPLYHLPAVHPALAAALRGYQRVGVRFAVDSDGELLAYVPGLGKSLTALAAIGEKQATYDGHYLIGAMRRPCRQVWDREITKWLSEMGSRAYVAVGSRKNKEKLFEEFQADSGEGGAFYITTYQTLAVKENKDPDDKYKTKVLSVEESFPEIVNYPYDAVIIDETHKVIRNLSVSGGGMAATGVKRVLHAAETRGALRQGLSGTPMPKQPEGLFGTLHALRRKEYRSKWTWIKTYFNTGGKWSEWEIQDLDAEAEEQLYRNLDTIIHRRTRAEVMPGYPEPAFVDVWCELEAEQRKQYDAIADGYDVDGVESLITLNDYLYLTQLAWSACRGQMGSLWPIEPSCKLDALLENLDDAGVLNQRGTSKHLVFTQFERNVRFIAEALEAKGVASYSLTGSTTDKQGDALLDDFMTNPDSPRVLVMTTQTGGVSLNLEVADYAHLMDSMWNPDDNEQAWLRGDRGSRTYPLTVFRYHGVDTVDSYRLEVLGSKEHEQKRVLDARRGVDLRREIVRRHRKAVA
jgi:SNF2 family DNA or RNA helicase